MKLVRLPRSPSSVSGVLPAEKIIGTLRREAFITAADAFPVPTITWTMTTCGSPVIMA